MYEYLAESAYKKENNNKRRIIQRKLEKEFQDNEIESNVDIFKGTVAEDERKTEADKINANNYEEIQIIDEINATGKIIIGNIKPEDFICTIDVESIENKKNDENEIILAGLKKRNFGFNYYGTDNEKSSDIAFSNKMALLGYINGKALGETDNNQTNNRLIDEIKEKIKLVDCTQKGYGESKEDCLSMAGNKWYMPDGIKTIKFADINNSYHNNIFNKWKDIANTLQNEEDKIRMEKIVGRISAFAKTIDCIKNKSLNLSDDDKKIWEENKKLISEDNKFWTVKDKTSLIKRAVRNIQIDENKIKNINKYNKDSVGKRDVEEFIKAGLILKNDEKYYWNVKNEKELGDKYALVGQLSENNDNRSDKEWLEILAIWNDTCQSDIIKKLVNNWSKTADMHLDSTGLENFKDDSSNEFSENELKACDLTEDEIKYYVDKINSASSTDSEQKYKWKASSVRELGDYFADNKNKYTGNLDDKWKKILVLWNKSNHKVFSYKLENKFNTWNQNTTEWGVNSTTYIGTPNETPYMGWSIFKHDFGEKLTKFNDVRPAEIPHKHPEQEEIYKVKIGTAYMYDNGNIVKVSAGANKVIKRGTPHCIVAAKGNYSHLVLQHPSGFHWSNNKEVVSVQGDLFQKVKEEENKEGC